jgi:FkbM family methyltransferase
VAALLGKIGRPDGRPASISDLERYRRLVKELAACRSAVHSDRPIARLLHKRRRKALLARLDREWPGGAVLHETGDHVFVPRPLDARGRACLLYPPRAHPAALAFLPDGGVAIDVGANLGEWALPLARRVGAGGRLYAFEPQPHIRGALGESLRLNNLTQASLLPYAVSDREGESMMALPQVTSSAVDSGQAHLGAPGSGEIGLAVETVTLDGFATRKGLTRLDLIKIDVEGHERAVLAGAASLLARFRPVIVLEIGHETADDRAAIHALLMGSGYGLGGILLDHGIAPAEWDDYRAGRGPFVSGEVHNLLLLSTALPEATIHGG